MFGVHLHSSHQASSYSNPHIDKAAIEMDKKKLPEALWKQEYMAEWQSEGGLVFPIRTQHFYPINFRSPRPGQTTYMGIDIGRTKDYTVITAFNSSLEQLGYLRINKTDWSTIKAAMRIEIEKFVQTGPVTVCIDETGVGSPIHEDLVNYFSSNQYVIIYPVNFSRSVDTKRNIVQQIRMLLADNLIKFWNIPEIKKEFEEFQYILDSKGNPIYSAPEGEDKFDDVVTSIGLAIHATKQHSPNIHIIRT